MRPRAARGDSPAEHLVPEQMYCGPTTISPYARIAGGFAIGVDIEDSKLAMATELGADHVVNARTEDPVAAILGSAAPMSRWRWRHPPPPSTRPTDRSGGVDDWSASRCRETTPPCNCRSSTRC